MRASGPSLAPQIGMLVKFSTDGLSYRIREDGSHSELRTGVVRGMFTPEHTLVTWLFVVVEGLDGLDWYPIVQRVYPLHAWPR